MALVVFGAGGLRLHANAGETFPHDVASITEVALAVAGLEARGLRSGYADYWSAYRATYFSSEGAIATPMLPPRFGRRVDRYPENTRHVKAVSAPAELLALVDAACELSRYVQPLGGWRDVTRTGGAFGAYLGYPATGRFRTRDVGAVAPRDYGARGLLA